MILQCIKKENQVTPIFGKGGDFMSIFTDVKNNIGFSNDDTMFDNELKTYIKLCIDDLSDIGVDIPVDLDITKSEFSILNPIGVDVSGHILGYVSLKVRLLIDTPSPTAAPIIERNIEQIFWRIREKIGLVVYNETGL